MASVLDVASCALFLQTVSKNIEIQKKEIVRLVCTSLRTAPSTYTSNVSEGVIPLLVHAICPLLIADFCNFLRVLPTLQEGMFSLQLFLWLP